MTLYSSRYKVVSVKVGRPKKKETTVQMCFRFQPDFARHLRRRAKTLKTSQVDVLQKTLFLHSKELMPGMTLVIKAIKH